MTTLLETRRVSKEFGGLRALSDASIQLHAGTILGIIGPNGAGKSTLLNCVSGADRPTSGSVIYAGSDVTRLPMHARAALGIRRTFQLERLIGPMSIVENVMAGMSHRRDYLTIEAVFGTRRFRRSEVELRARAMDLLDRLGLSALAEASPATIPPGRRRLVEIARAYISDPRVLLLDEPTGGLSTEEAEEVFRLLGEFRQEGRAIAVIEHRIRTAAEISDALVVLDQGRVVAAGDPDTVRASDSVLSAYLGERTEAA